MKNVIWVCLEQWGGEKLVSHSRLRRDLPLGSALGAETLARLQLQHTMEGVSGAAARGCGITAPALQRGIGQAFICRATLSGMAETTSPCARSGGSSFHSGNHNPVGGSSAFCNCFLPSRLKFPTRLRHFFPRSSPTHAVLEPKGGASHLTPVLKSSCCSPVGLWLLGFLQSTSLPLHRKHHKNGSTQLASWAHDSNQVLSIT